MEHPLPASRAARTITLAARRLQDAIGAISDLLMKMGGVILVLAMYAVMASAALGVLYGLVRFLKWAWNG